MLAFRKRRDRLVGMRSADLTTVWVVRSAVLGHAAEIASAAAAPGARFAPG